MIKFYFNGSPNPNKVALFLEESGLAYQPIPIDARKGEQLRPEFLAINPNGKVPVIEDEETVVFDSNAILLYLAEKSGMFLPPGGAENRGALLSWLMFVATGIGPYSGQAVHFQHFAPEQIPYARQRYRFEALRHLKVIDQRLADRRFIMGDVYTIVDMALWGWARVVPFVLGDEAWNDLPRLKRLVDEISSRPAAERAIALKDRFEFKADWDEAARRNMFRHIYAEIP